jgi:mRNA interferase MazF
LPEKILRTGDIYRVQLDPAVGHEMNKTRPVIVVNPGDVKSLRLAIVVPVTAWKPHWEGNAFFLTLEPTTQHGLTKKSAVDCYQIRALSHDRFLERLGELSSAEIEKVKRALSLILDIEARHCV